MAEAKKQVTKKTAAPKATGAKAVAGEAPTKTLHRRIMVGVVVSDKMMKTRVVRIERQVKEGMYGKYISKANKFKIHDENNKSKVGDLVAIVESRPLSRDKRWALQEILRSASGEVLTKV